MPQPGLLRQVAAIAPVRAADPRRRAAAGVRIAGTSAARSRTTLAAVRGTRREGSELFSRCFRVTRKKKERKRHSPLMSPRERPTATRLPSVDPPTPRNPNGIARRLIDSKKGLLRISRKKISVERACSGDRPQNCCHGGWRQPPRRLCGPPFVTPLRLLVLSSTPLPLQRSMLGGGRFQWRRCHRPFGGDETLDGCGAGGLVVRHCPCRCRRRAVLRPPPRHTRGRRRRIRLGRRSRPRPRPPRG